MHAARLNSPRLQRVLRLLADGKPRTTREIVRAARVMAVSACVAELRAHGAEISCTQVVVGDKRRFIYRMTKEPRNV